MRRSGLWLVLLAIPLAAQDAAPKQDALTVHLSTLAESWGTRWYYLRQRGMRVGALSIQIQKASEDAKQLNVAVVRIQKVGTVWAKLSEQWTVHADAQLTPKKLVSTMRAKGARNRRVDLEFDHGKIKGRRVSLDDGGKESGEPQPLEKDYPAGAIPMSLVPVFVAALPFEAGSRKISVATFDDRGDFEPASGTLDYRTVVAIENAEQGGSKLHYFSLLLKHDPDADAWSEHRFYVSEKREFVRKDFDGESIPEQIQWTTEERVVKGIPIKDLD